jgi:uncharacterized Ntn-hydrolase superfamily protein
MKRLVIAATVVTLLPAAEAHATWSVAARNPETGTLVVAGASCSYMVYGIATVIPGKGVVIVQAASNARARNDAAAMLESGAPLQEIMATLSDPASRYSEQEQQYALLASDPDSLPLTYTGAEVDGAKGASSSRNFTVQANTMVSDSVVAETALALGEGLWTGDMQMVDSVMSAMQAGAAAGGDKRCAGSGSSSAFMSVFRSGDDPRQPWLNLVVFGIEPGRFSALGPLQMEYADWFDHGKRNPSTQQFLIPAAPLRNEARQ